MLGRPLSFHFPHQFQIFSGVSDYVWMGKSKLVPCLLERQSFGTLRHADECNDPFQNNFAAPKATDKTFSTGYHIWICMSEAGPQRTLTQSNPLEKLLLTYLSPPVFIDHTCTFSWCSLSVSLSLSLSSGQLLQPCRRLHALPFFLRIDANCTMSPRFLHCVTIKFRIVALNLTSRSSSVFPSLFEHPRLTDSKSRIALDHSPAVIWTDQCWQAEHIHDDEGMDSFGCFRIFRVPLPQESWGPGRRAITTSYRIVIGILFCVLYSCEKPFPSCPRRPTSKF